MKQAVEEGHSMEPGHSDSDSLFPSGDPRQRPPSHSHLHAHPTVPPPATSFDHAPDERQLADAHPSAHEHGPVLPPVPFGPQLPPGFKREGGGLHSLDGHTPTPPEDVITDEEAITPDDAPRPPLKHRESRALALILVHDYHFYHHRHLLLLSPPASSLPPLSVFFLIF